MTTMNMIMLKESTNRIGPKNAPKNTPVLLMKQLPMSKEIQTLSCKVVKTYNPEVELFM